MVRRHTIVLSTRSAFILSSAVDSQALARTPR